MSKRGLQRLTSCKWTSRSSTTTTTAHKDLFANIVTIFDLDNKKRRASTNSNHSMLLQQHQIETAHYQHTTKRDKSTSMENTTPEGHPQQRRSPSKASYNKSSLTINNSKARHSNKKDIISIDAKNVETEESIKQRDTHNFMISNNITQNKDTNNNILCHSNEYQHIIYIKLIIVHNNIRVHIKQNIRTKLRILEDFRIFELSSFVGVGRFGTLWIVGPRRGFRKISKISPITAS